MIILATGAIVSMTVLKERRGQGLTYADVGTLRLKRIEKIQEALSMVTALASMYLSRVM